VAITLIELAEYRQQHRFPPWILDVLCNRFPVASAATQWQRSHWLMWGIGGTCLWSYLVKMHQGSHFFFPPLLSSPFFLHLFRSALKLVSLQPQSGLLLTGSRQRIDGSIIWAQEHKKADPPLGPAWQPSRQGGLHLLAWERNSCRIKAHSATHWSLSRKQYTPLSLAASEAPHALSSFGGRWKHVGLLPRPRGKLSVESGIKRNNKTTKTTLDYQSTCPIILWLEMGLNERPVKNAAIVRELPGNVVLFRLCRDTLSAIAVLFARGRFRAEVCFLFVCVCVCSNLLNPASLGLKWSLAYSHYSHISTIGASLPLSSKDICAECCLQERDKSHIWGTCKVISHG